MRIILIYLSPLESVYKKVYSICMPKCVLQFFSAYFPDIM